jgi:hypothetical protein
MGIKMVPDDENKLVPARAAGGIARAAALTKGKRKEIAQKAAQARWSKDIPRVTHAGILKIGDAEIPCYVLEDGTRVLSERGLLSSFRMKAGARDTEEKLPRYLRGKNIVPFIDQELKDRLSNPLWFQYKNEPTRKGFPAALLPEICNVWLKARDAKVLIRKQILTAEVADILMRGLAHVGVIALVDEATGYQEVRDRMALQAILDAYLRKELAAWAKRFPDEFYRQIFRLRNWEWKGMKVNRPQVVAHYTNDFVWERLAPGILDELKNRMPKDDKGRNKGRYPQLLTEDVGHPALSQHIHAVTTLMTASRNWDDFKRMMNVALPKKGTNLEFDFGPAK